MSGRDDELLADPPGDERRPIGPVDSSPMSGRDDELLADPPGGERRSIGPEADSSPNAGRDDELLADPPEGEYHLGGLGGHRSGARQRLVLHLALGFSLVGAVVAGYLYVDHLEARARERVQFFQLPEGSELTGRARVMTWSGGRARLGLHREPPGVHTIELPDRTVTLAEGCEFAQIRVHVVAGETVAFKVVVGEVDVTPR